MANVLVLFFAERSNGMLSWAAGFLAQSSWDTSYALITTAVLAMLVCLPLLKPLTLMSLDDSQARRLGVPINGIRALVVLVVAVVTALVIIDVTIDMIRGIGAHSVAPPFSETSDRLCAKLTSDDMPP